jgi:hypothetical protein
MATAGSVCTSCAFNSVCAQATRSADPLTDSKKPPTSLLRRRPSAMAAGSVADLLTGIGKSEAVAARDLPSSARNQRVQDRATSLAGLH